MSVKWTEIVFFFFVKYDTADFHGPIDSLIYPMPFIRLRKTLMHTKERLSFDQYSKICVTKLIVYLKITF